MIMNAIVMLVLVFGGVWAQVLFPAFAPIGQAKPPFLLAIVLYYALTRSPNTTLCAGFLAGMAHDVMTAVPLGYSSLVFVVVGVVVGRFRNLVLSESRLTAGFFGCVASLVTQLVLYAILLRSGAVWWPVGRLVVRILAGAALAAVATPLTFMAARRFDQWVGNSEVREIIDGIEQPIGR
ncbi:MAG: rod shape-determining protein MreD [Verrucomicrobia bacterium]|nr:rod shape-determining protein MreD [Verrucomicrobiota bacterium]MBT7067187.1 rod shape-determining protein MreD [Verrucomicrobiota bacterium]MBT7699740.1 rod shape-determining protein MreD [Verrucomicrobiota bacterium]